MKTLNLRPQVAIAALALSAMLCSVPAFAQQRNVNDGGQVSVPAGAKLDAAPASAPATPHYGRHVADGGTPPQPPVAQMKAAKARNKTANQKPVQHIGRNVDDGGLVDAQ